MFYYINYVVWMKPCYFFILSKPCQLLASILSAVALYLSYRFFHGYLSVKITEHFFISHGIEGITSPFRENFPCLLYKTARHHLPYPRIYTFIELAVIMYYLTSFYLGNLVTSQSYLYHLKRSRLLLARPIGSVRPARLLTYFQSMNYPSRIILIYYFIILWVSYFQFLQQSRQAFCL